MLWDYVQEVRTKNPGSSVYLGLNPNGSNKFEKLFVCLATCKEGFKSSRMIIGVDGCHLKGKYGGILLTVVGIDPNNNIYPISWVVVRSETYET